MTREGNQVMGKPAWIWNLDAWLPALTLSLPSCVTLAMQLPFLALTPLPAIQALGWTRQQSLSSLGSE